MTPPTATSTCEWVDNRVRVLKQAENNRTSRLRAAGMMRDRAALFDPKDYYRKQ